MLLPSRLPTAMSRSCLRVEMTVVTSSGDEVPIATQSAVSVLTPDAPIVNSIAFRNTGVILNIIPRVSEDGRVLLEIEQEVSDVRETTSSTIDSPTIQQRRVKTTVVVNNGGSVVLAGMMQDRASRIRQQIPLAGDIPLLGNLFKNKDDNIRRTELLIAITPHVVTDGAARFLLDVPGPPVLAKTGTAEFGSGDDVQTHAWMIGAQGDLAVCVYVDVGESGSGTAGPILEAFLRAARR